MQDSAVLGDMRIQLSATPSSAVLVLQCFREYYRAGNSAEIILSLSLNFIFTETFVMPVGSTGRDGSFSSPIVPR